MIPGPSGTEEVPVHLAPAAEVAEPGEARLRDNRDFLVVLFGQGISSFGDSITNTAMPLLVLALTGSGLAMGVVGVLTTLPDLIVGLPAGAYADRWDRRKMMFGADLGRCVLTALVPISVYLDGPTLAVILAVTFPMNVLRVLWLAAYTASVPGPRGPGGGPPGQRHLRGRVQRRLDRRPGARRVPGGDHRPRRDDRDRRRHVPALGRRDAARPAAPQGGGAERGDAHRRRHPRGRRVRGPPADAARVHRPVDDDVGDRDGPHHGHDLLHHGGPRARVRGRGRRPVGVRAGIARGLGPGREAGVPGDRAS